MSLRCFACALLLTGCGESMGLDAGMDAGPRDAGYDAGRDAGQALDAGTAQCLPYAANLVGPDGGPGLAATIGDAVQACALNACSGCALAGGTGPSCGAGGTMTSCVLACFERNDFGACPAAGGCPSGQTCDGAASVCRSDAVGAVNDAVAAGDVDLGCLTCYANIPQCVAENDCVSLAGGCLAPSSCACFLCQCNNGCVDAFATCSGLPPYSDCAAIEAMCGP